MAAEMNNSNKQLDKVSKVDKNIAKIALGTGVVALAISAKFILERASAQY